MIGFIQLPYRSRETPRRDYTSTVIVVALGVVLVMQLGLLAWGMFVSGS